MAAISPITLVFSAIDQATPVLKNIVSQAKDQFEVVTQLSNAYNEITGAFQQLAAIGSGAYQKLIGQNVELQNQLLSTQASLVATQAVMENGIQIKDPTKAIQALTEPVNKAVERVRQGSLELVGVTSADLIPLFQITAQASAGIGANLEQSADLTLSFAAALGTLQIPLFQAQQELQSIYESQITSDSQLATSLSINNEMVNKWKSQGIFVKELTTRLEAFRAGNKLSAQTISGITSNIEELVDGISRIAGQPLLQPIVTQLDNLYKFLDSNKETIQSIAVSVVNFFLDIGTKLGGVLTTLEPVFKTLGEAAFKQITAEATAAAQVITILVDSFALLVNVATPLLQVMANLVLAFAEFSSTPIGGIIIQTTLLLGLFSGLLPVIAAITKGLMLARGMAILFFATAQGNAAAALVLKGLNSELAALAISYFRSGGGVMGFAAALGTATASAKAFLLSLIPIMTALTPLIAIGGTIAIILTVYKGEQIKEALGELEDFTALNDKLSDQALDTAKNLKILNQAAKDNGSLTKEQEAQLKKYQKAAKDQIEALQNQIKYLKELKVPPEVQATQDMQIKQLELMIGLLERQSGGISLQNKEIPKLGNDFEQLGKKISSALGKLERPLSPENFKEGAEELIDFTQQLADLGGVSTEVAIKNLARIRDDARVEFETRQAAQEAIIKLRQSETDEAVEALSQQGLAVERLVAGEIISQVEGQKQITYNKILQLKEQLNAVKQSIKEETELRNAQIKDQVSNIDKQIVEANKRKEAALKSGDKQGARLAGEDIAKLQRERASAQASINIDSERLQTLKTQEAKFKTDLDKTVVQQRTEQRQQRLKDYDEQQSLLDASLAERLISQQQYNAESLNITRLRADEELRVLQEQEDKLRPGREGKDGREEIEAKRAVIRKRLAEANEKFVSDSLDNQVQDLEKAQRKALDIVTQSEQDRLVEITKLEADELITSAKANELRIDNTKKTLDTEIKLEEEKLKTLLALPSYIDPEKEEQRQSQIRASRLRTTQLTKQLIDNEVQQREATFRVFEDIKNKEIQTIQNQVTGQSQILENQIKFNDLATKSLSIQSGLISARKDLISSSVNYIEGSLKILSEIAKSDTEKKELAESAAEVRLKAVQEQAVFERKILELNIEQNEAALENERIQLRIEMLKARSATLKAQAEQAITEENPNATKGQKEAARLNTEAAIESEGLLGEQVRILDSKEFANQRQAQYSRMELRDRTRLSEDQARLNLANSRVDQDRGKREREQLGRDIRSRKDVADDGSGGFLRINENTGRNLRFIRRETEFELNKFNEDGSVRDPKAEAREQSRLNDIRQTLAQALGLKLDNLPIKPVQVASPQPIPQTQFTGNIPQNTIVNRDGKLSPNVGGNFTFNINNTFSPTDVASGKAASTFTEQIRTEMYQIFTLASK